MNDDALYTEILADLETIRGKIQLWDQRAQEAPLSADEMLPVMQSLPEGRERPVQKAPPGFRREHSRRLRQFYQSMHDLLVLLAVQAAPGDRITEVAGSFPAQGPLRQQLDRQLVALTSRVS